MQSVTHPIKYPSKLDRGPFNSPLHSVNVELNGKKYQLASPTHIRGLIALMDMQAVLGGAASHFGGPSAFAEINSALFGYIFSSSKDDSKMKSNGSAWCDRYNLVNDAGHCENGIYALKALYGFADLNIQSLKSFRAMDSKLTGHGELHMFPEGVLLSNGPLGSAVAQAQGLAVADKFLGNDRVTVLTVSDGACMEGEAKEALASIPGLAKQGKQNPFLMIISDNNTKLSGRIDKDAFSMSPTFESLSALGWKVITVEDGHNLKTCLEQISKALENIKSDQPWALHIKTIKGYGHKASMDSASGGHGFPLKKAAELDQFLAEIFQDQEIPKDFISWKEELKNYKSQDPSYVYKSKNWSWLNDHKAEKIQVGVSKALVECKEKGFPIVSVTSDLPGSTGVDGFRKKFPESCIDIGVAESNMISLASGLSKNGLIPIVDTFAQFGVTKGALPITMGNLSKAPVIAIFSHTGFQDAADGASHQALSYFSMMASIPGNKVFALTSSEEAYAAVTQAVEDFKSRMEKDEELYSYIFFLGRENFKPTFSLDSKIKYDLSKTEVIQESKSPKATIVAVGSMLEQAITAADELSLKGIEVDILNPLCLNQVDIFPIIKSLDKSGGRLITIEDHQIAAGFGYYLSGLISEAKPGTIKKHDVLGVKSEFGQSAYLAQQLYDKHEMGSGKIVSLLK
jgi:transketolase